MLEVEVKYRTADHAALAAALERLGAVLTSDHVEADHYFNAPDRDFKKTDEAFRLRRVGPANRLTYKGPKVDTATKTRQEIEVPLADGDEVAADAGRMLTSLGYRPVAVVRKRRRLYHLLRGEWAVEACLDTVDGVGAFAELEVRAADDRFADAKAVVLAVAAELGLGEQERRSYLSMLLSPAGEEPC